MNNLPEPLTPAGCDLSGNTWFPLHFQRLQKSRWWRSASDLARSRNVDLWAEAYLQVPAASLPNDDVELADFAGFGRDVRGFQKAKAEIMAPWTLCSDGRWYHPTMAEVALAAWEKLGDRRRKDRERQAQHRAKARGKPDVVTPGAEPVTRDNPTQSRVTPPPVTLDFPTEERRGEEKKDSDPTDQAQSAAPDHSKEAWRRAVSLLERQGRMRDAKARELFGKLLRDHGLEARDLLSAIVKAETSATEDPQAYLSAAARALAERRGSNRKPTAQKPGGTINGAQRCAFSLRMAAGLPRLALSRTGPAAKPQRTFSPKDLPHDQPA